MVPIERSFQELSVAIETVRIDGDLMEIWPNEVCDRFDVRDQLCECMGNSFLPGALITSMQ